MVVGGTGISSGLSNVCSDERLTVKLQAHSVGWALLRSLNVVVVWTGVLVALGEVVPHRGTEAPRCRLVLIGVQVGIIGIGRWIVAPSYFSFLLASS